MEKISQIFNNLPQNNIINSVILILVNFLIYKIITQIFIKSEKNKRFSKKLNNRSRTYLKLTTSFVKYVFIILTILVLLQINGIDVSSMLAGLGIVSVIIGLAVQDALKDIIRGFSILSESYFSVGDVVKYNNFTGKVLSLGLRTTKIKDLSTENIISISNRNIEQIEVISSALYINFPMPYELPINKAESIISKIQLCISEIDGVENVEYKGVTELADSSIKYLLKITCNPEQRLQLRRDALSCILKVMAKNNVQVPYNQIDVHQK